MTSNLIQNVTPRRSRPYMAGWQRGSISSTTATTILGITVIFGVAFLSFFYLGQVQDTASQGTDIQSLEERLIELNDRQRSLELESAQLRSLQTIEDSIPELNLVSTGSVTYLAKPLEKVVTASSP